MSAGTSTPTPATPSASIILPTIGRPDYLQVALESVTGQARALDAEVVVVSDGADDRTAALAVAHGARLVSLSSRQGVNGARNAGIQAAAADTLIFLDDDVRVSPGWLEAMLAAIRSAPDCDVFAGAIRGQLEGGPRSCGREPPPISTYDFGPVDRDVPYVFGGNTAIRRSAFERIGQFRDELSGRGDEEEWVLRLTAAGGRLRYVAGATIDHRRTGNDARLPALARAAYRQGREARRHDIRVGKPRSIAAELRILAGCAWHAVRRRCAYGIVMGARAAGSLREALTATSLPPSDDFLSGTSGQVHGVRATTRALCTDLFADAHPFVRAQRWRLRHAIRRAPRRRVLALSVERADAQNLLASTRRELLHSRHDVSLDSKTVGNAGKFENLNTLLARHSLSAYDWVLVIDDDVALPRRFLDTFLFLVEHVDLRVAQPAHRARSHAAWPVTRRRAGSLVRETAYVEIGPVTAFHASTFDVLLPFPPLRAGWGLDAHWAAVAREHGWRIGIVDATPISHHVRRIAAFYDRGEAIAEGRRFLVDKPYVRAADAKTIATHRTLGTQHDRCAKRSRT
jgi:GT2 family glycosyltransferase